MSASQTAAFYGDVTRTKRLWTLKDAGGFPAPKNSRGIRVQPFWSSLARVERIIKNVPAYQSFSPVEVSWIEFRDQWLPKLQRDRMHVGINWSGSNASGFDLSPSMVREAMDWHIEHAAPAG